MTDTDKVFAGSIPGFYDRYMGPMLFVPYAADLAARLGDMKEGRLLETAAGTGIVTRALDKALPRSIEITATDLNQPMLDHAATQLSSSRVAWRQANAQELPFEAASFDTVVCQFGVMFFPDKVKAYAEARRVLKPGGKFLFNAWDRIGENEFADTVTQAMKVLFPDDPPSFLARTPYGYHDPEQIQRELKQAGFREVTWETVTRRSRAASPRDPAIGMCQGSPLRSEIEARNADRLQEATVAATDAIAARFGFGAVDGKIQAHIIEARG